MSAAASTVLYIIFQHVRGCAGRHVRSDTGERVMLGVILEGGGGGGYYRLKRCRYNSNLTVLFFQKINKLLEARLKMALI